jgi:crossover junction endodeoxyribonuclease RuvC
MTNKTTILGIDPGSVVMGYAIIEITGKQIKLIEMDVLSMGTKKDVYERLGQIFERIDNVIRKYKPNQCAIEAPFFGKNVQSMLKLGRAQGVAIACAMQHKLSVTEYSPKKVKQSITGNGNANKEQVQAMLQRIFTANEIPKIYDATDALAVAVCHHYQQGPGALLQISKSKGWEDFIKNNPHKLSKK